MTASEQGGYTGLEPAGYAARIGAAGFRGMAERSSVRGTAERPPVNPPVQGVMEHSLQGEAPQYDPGKAAGIPLSKERTDRSSPYVASIVRKLIAEYGEMDMPSSGTSMFPLIREGNICRFAVWKGELPKKGDILLAEAPSGGLVGHRLIRVVWYGGDWQLICKGDSNVNSDPPLAKAQIIGKLVHVRKGQRVLLVHRGLARVWGLLFCAFPGLSRVIRLYLRLKGYSRG